MLKVSVVDGCAYFYTEDDVYKFSADDLRRVYCAVLGIELWGTTIQEELDAVNKHSYISVDMPEDVLKARKVMELNGVL